MAASTLTEGPGRADAKQGDQPETEAALWSAWREQRSVAARENLVLLHLPYARKVALRMYRARAYMGIEYADFYQLACIGLLEALERYDPGHEAAFRTFAHSRIEGSVLDGLQHLTEVNEQVSLRRRMQRERLASLKGDTRAAPRTSEQVLAELSEIAVGLAIGLMLEETAMYRAETHESVDTAYSTVAWRQARELMLGAVRTLPDRERQVIVLHYLHGLTFEHIGAVLELTKGRISQLHREALLLLRAGLGPVDHFTLAR